MIFHCVLGVRLLETVDTQGGSQILGREQSAREFIPEVAGIVYRRWERSKAGVRPAFTEGAGNCSGQWSVVSGQWSVVSGRWSVVGGQWSVVSGQSLETAGGSGDTVG